MFVSCFYRKITFMGAGSGKTSEYRYREYAPVYVCWKECNRGVTNRCCWAWWMLHSLSCTEGHRGQSGLRFKSGKLIGWLCLSPATSLVLQSAAVLVSRPDQVNYLRDTTGEYGLHHVIEQNITLASIYLCNRAGNSLLLLF